MSDNTDRAALAAFTVLGAEIARLQCELEAERVSVGVASERSREWRERCDELQRELYAKEGETALLRDECAALRDELAQTQQAGAAISWEAVQQLMVQSGVDSIGRNGLGEWIVRDASGNGYYYTRATLHEAATDAANAFAASHGKGRV